MNTWIFQGNPSYYAIRAAVQELREVAWRTNQYRNKIQHGDRVYIWESGPAGGIVAVARVLAAPCLMLGRPEEYKFVLNHEMLPDEVYRVPLEIVRIVMPILMRQEIRSLPVLSNLSILRRPNATNFPVTANEALVLEQLLASQLQLR